MNIVLIDDDKSAAKPLRAILESHFRDLGVVVYHADNFDTGIAMVRDRNAALVLLDLGLPNMSPLQTVDCIKRFPKGCLVMCYTGHEDDIIVQAANTAGAVGFIRKSDSVETKIDKVQHVVANILSAKVRIKVDEREGTMLTSRRAAKLTLPAIATVGAACLTALAFLVGNAKGFWNGAKETGRSEASQTEHFKRLDEDVAELKQNAKQDQQWQRRIEINLAKLLQKNGIEPEREP